MGKIRNVCVITFFQSQDNYGQLLQCYALQETLKKLGIISKVIRYGFHEKYFRWFVKQNFTTKLGIKGLIKKILRIDKKKIQNDRGFDLFRRKYLRLTRNTYNNIEELQSKPPKADCYIAGSDQVWAQLLSNPNNRSFFLDFGNRNIKRISYAPSFAVKDYPDELKKTLRKNLSRFDAISVREKTGVDICNSVGYSAKLVLDPTLLLEKNDYERIAIVPKEKDYCFIYHVNIENASELEWPRFKEYNEINKIKSYATYANPIKGIDMRMMYGADYLYPSIQEWLGMIKNAKYVLTSSFHGVVFSIVFHVPFLVYLRTETLFAGNDRIITLLDELGLNDRIVNLDKNVIQLLTTNIDWDVVELKLRALRKDSISFLRDSL